MQAHNHRRFGHHRLGHHRLGTTAPFCGALLLAVSMAASGCTICPSPYDYDYGAFGSRTPRTDMRNGRVGSIFSDPDLTGSVAVRRLPSEPGEEVFEDILLEEGDLGETYEMGETSEGIEIVEP